MKNAAWGIALASLAFASAAQAALHPFYQRNKEIQAILDDAGVKSRVETYRQPPFGKLPSSGLVDGVSWAGNVRNGSRYLVKSGNCSVFVTIAYKDVLEPIPGPVDFDVYTERQMTCEENEPMAQ